MWFKRNKLKLIKAKEELKVLQEQGDIKRYRYKTLENKYSEELISRGLPGVVHLLPDEVCWSTYSGQSELQKIEGRITELSIIDGELDLMFNQLLEKLLNITYSNSKS